MKVKFLKAYGVFSPGEIGDVLTSKAAELKAQGIITDDPALINPKKVRKTPDAQEAKTVEAKKV